MNIKYITNVRLPTAKAQGYAIMKMCSEFARAGVHVKLFVPERKNFEITEDVFDYYGIERNFEIQKISGFDLLGQTERFGRIFYWLDIFTFIIGLKKVIKNNFDDVIYTRDFVLASFFSKKQCIVLELHAIPKSRFFFKRALKKASLFVVLNQHIKTILVSLGVDENAIVVSPSGVDMADFNSQSGDLRIAGIEKNNFVYGYVGALKTMGMEKGVDLGIETLKLLPKEFVFLVVGGEPNEIAYYRTVSQTHGVADRVIFAGKVNHFTVGEYIARCNAVIAPFPDNEHYKYFMSPLKIFEYMASRKPIIATDLPSLREVLVDGQTAILVPPDNIQALADAIIKLKENPEYAKTISDKAYRDVLEKYTWEERVRGIIQGIKRFI